MSLHNAAGLGGAILPGMLCASLFPAIIGSQFPGALYLTQTLNFRQPALVRCVLLKVQPLRVALIAWQSAFLPIGGNWSNSGGLLCCDVMCVILPGIEGCHL